MRFLICIGAATSLAGPAAAICIPPRTTIIDDDLPDQVEYVACVIAEQNDRLSKIEDAIHKQSQSLETISRQLGDIKTKLLEVRSSQLEENLGALGLSR